MVCLESGDPSNSQNRNRPLMEIWGSVSPFCLRLRHTCFLKKLWGFYIWTWVRVSIGKRTALMIWVVGVILNHDMSLYFVGIGYMTWRCSYQNKAQKCGLPPSPSQPMPAL